MTTDPAPRLISDDLVRLIELLRGADSVELKLTVPDSDNQIVVVENGACATPRERVVQVTLDLD